MLEPLFKKIWADALYKTFLRHTGRFASEKLLNAFYDYMNIRERIEDTRVTPYVVNFAERLAEEIDLYVKACDFLENLGKRILHLIGKIALSWDWDEIEKGLDLSEELTGVPCPQCLLDGKNTPLKIKPTKRGNGYVVSVYCELHFPEAMNQPAVTTVARIIEPKYEDLLAKGTVGEEVSRMLVQTLFQEQPTKIVDAIKRVITTGSITRSPKMLQTIVEDLKKVLENYRRAGQSGEGRAKARSDLITKVEQVLNFVHDRGTILVLFFGTEAAREWKRKDLEERRARGVGGHHLETYYGFDIGEFRIKE